MSAIDRSCSRAASKTLAALPRTSNSSITLDHRIASSHSASETVAIQEQVTPSDLPESALHYVIRTQQSVLLDDALSDNGSAGGAEARAEDDLLV
jgi:hypothetical protein